MDKEGERRAKQI